MHRDELRASLYNGIDFVHAGISPISIAMVDSTAGISQTLFLLIHKDLRGFYVRGDKLYGMVKILLMHGWISPLYIIGSQLDLTSRKRPAGLAAEW